MDIVHVETYKGHKITISRDESPESPDSWEDENLFLVGFDDRNFSIDRDGFDKETIEALFSGQKIEDEYMAERVKEIKEQYHAFILEAYIHSGIVLKLWNGGALGYDSSITGAVFVSKEHWKTKESARHTAENLLMQWNDYLSGNVYALQIDTYEEDGESGYGYFGDWETSGILNDARKMVDDIDPVAFEKMKRQQRVDALTAWEMTLEPEERDAISRSTQSIKKTLEKFSKTDCKTCRNENSRDPHTCKR